MTSRIAGSAQLGCAVSKVFISIAKLFDTAGLGGHSHGKKERRQREEQRARSGAAQGQQLLELPAWFLEIARSKCLREDSLRILSRGGLEV